MIRIIAGGGNVHHAAADRAGRGIGDTGVGEESFTEERQVIDDHVAALSDEIIDGRDHIGAGQRAGEIELGSGGQIVDNFEQSGAFIAAAGERRVDGDGGQFGADAGAVVHAIGDHADLDPGAIDSQRRELGTDLVGLEDAVSGTGDGIGESVVGQADRLDTPQVGNLLEFRDGTNACATRMSPTTPVTVAPSD